MLDKIIKGMIKGNTASRQRLKGGLYLSYSPGETESTLTVYRHRQYPSPTEVKVVIDILVRVAGMPTRQEWEPAMRIVNGESYGCIVLGWASQPQPSQPALFDVRKMAHNYSRS